MANPGVGSCCVIHVLMLDLHVGTWVFALLWLDQSWQDAEKNKYRDRAAERRDAKGEYASWLKWSTCAFCAEFVSSTCA